MGGASITIEIYTIFMTLCTGGVFSHGVYLVIWFQMPCELVVPYIYVRCCIVIYD